MQRWSTQVRQHDRRDVPVVGEELLPGDAVLWPQGLARGVQLQVVAIQGPDRLVVLRHGRCSGCRQGVNRTSSQMGQWSDPGMSGEMPASMTWPRHRSGTKL